jgi:hypothetical protein
MNKTITGAAKKEDFNSEQIARVVQSANKKVFIKLFPQKHEFDVARFLRLCYCFGKLRDRDSRPDKIFTLTVFP